MQQIIPVFIASPSDVPHERALAEGAILDLSPRLLSLFDAALQVVSWKDFAPIAAPTAGRTFQDDINLRLERSGVFLGILSRRWGTAVSARGQVSGTEMEFDLALQSPDRIKSQRRSAVTD